MVSKKLIKLSINTNLFLSCRKQQSYDVNLWLVWALISLSNRKAFKMLTPWAGIFFKVETISREREREQQKVHAGEKMEWEFGDPNRERALMGVVEMG